MAGYPYSRLFHLSTNRAPFFLRKANHNLRAVHTGPSIETVHEDPILRFAYPVPLERETNLKAKLNRIGIHLDSYRPGQNYRFLCPRCKGGKLKETSFSILINENGLSSKWICFRASCGWKGGIGDMRDISHVQETVSFPKPVQKPKEFREITEQKLDLRPLNDDLINYFRSRGISAETLRRNNVMQKISRTGIPAIAFTYRRDGVLVNCKYRELPKKFWQESGTEKILYGLDDIKSQKDIIIVEGEMDKLSFEEAGFKNCVSVPNGAPAKVANKELPNKEKDTTYQYLWNCNDYLSSASRIILAADGDGPGQALAEELARRLGKERCWSVKWPLRNNVDGLLCKDANEVLVYLGAETLKEVIENAEMYPIKGLHRFKEFYNEIDIYYQGWKARR